MSIDRRAKDRAVLETGLPGTLLAELRALLAQGRQIEAIRRYRVETGAAPAEAKAAVETIGRSKAPVSLGNVIRILAAFFWLLAILLTVAAGWQAHDRRVVKDSWPTVEAEVVKCSVVAHTPSRSPAFSTLECRLRYGVAGVERVAKTTSTGIPSAEQEAAMHVFVARHRPGSRQFIHYDPDDPQRISLGDADLSFQADTPAHRLRLAGLFAGGGVLFGGLVMWLTRRRRNDPSEDSPVTQ